jgi:hypothetical protein
MERYSQWDYNTFFAARKGNFKKEGGKEIKANLPPDAFSGSRSFFKRNSASI